MWIVFIIVLCVALAATSLRTTETMMHLQSHRLEPTINPASLPDVGMDGPRLSQDDGVDA